jgi:pyruvate/2-oxoglutarate dehydrogenase complex dihydrolipoamide dehydrogenase (E3) component
MKKYDLVVIGGGAGGLVAAAGAASLGAKVALIDKDKLGGDCLWTGCIPTKSLIHSAKIVQAARKSKIFGLEQTGWPQFSIAKKRLNQSIATIQKHDDPERFRAMGIDVYHGYASFDSPHQIRMDDSELIYGKRIVIATGSRPFVPPIEGLQETGFLTNETALQLTEQPKSLLVVGSGPIGLEFAQSFARFGTKVTVVEMASGILMKEDSELVPYVKRALEQEGVTFHTGAKMVEVSLIEDLKEVIIEKDGQPIKLRVNEILMASGRKPNTDRLRLEKAGLNTDRGYISVNEHLQTRVPHIYAIGDVNGKFPFTHAAGYEGKIVVSNAVFGLKRKVDYSNLPWVTYTDPEVFHLGMTEQQARDKYGDIKVYKTELGEVDRFVADHETAGLVKIITDSKGRILGAHAVGSGAGDWMQEVVFAKQHGHKIGDISHVIHPYPTHAGAVQRTADLYWREKLFSGWLPKLLKTYIRCFR